MSISNLSSGSDLWPFYNYSFCYVCSLLCSAGENVFCVLVFVLIYFGSMAALGWLVVFAYVWNLTCNSVGNDLTLGWLSRKTASCHGIWHQLEKLVQLYNITCQYLFIGRIRERIDRQAVYFHALSWLFSLVLTAISLSLGKVKLNWLLRLSE